LGGSGSAAKVSQVSFFCPLEIIAKALNRERTTIWRRLKELQELGYVTARPHYTTYRGRTMIDGTVWAVKINPQQGTSARLSYEDLKARYRNLSQDVEDGRTAYNVKTGVIQQSSIHKDRQALIQELLAWTLPPENTKTPVTFDCCKTDLLQVLDVPHVDKSERSQAVNHAAQAIGMALNDSNSINFYRQLLWQLLRRYNMNTNSGDEFQSLHDEVRRAQTDVNEGFARKGGAVLVSRLKQWMTWDDIRRTPIMRISEKSITG
jgi:DNA-binding Lrp family transcriptional regulator